MPGVQITTTARSGPSTPTAAASGQAFFVGLSTRGPVGVATLVKGMADFTRVYGSRASFGYLYDTVATFFNEGGTQCYVVRVVGAAATSGTVTLKDKNGVAANTLKVDAANAGAWSAGLTMTVANGTIAGTFRMTLALNGSVVQDFNNLSTPTDAVNAFAGSVYVKVTDLGSATVAPNNQPANGAFTLSAGADDRLNVATSDYTGALAYFTKDMGDGAVAIPGLSTAVHTALIAHAVAFNRVALLSHTSDAAVSDLTSAVSGIAANGEYAGLFAPWVQISDGANGTIDVPPEGYVAAVRNRAVLQVGPWRAPAGQIASANTLVGLTNYYDDTTGNTLDDSHVSVIRKIAGTVRLYGWRSLSGDTQNYKFLSARDVMNRVAVESANRVEKYVFGVIDPKGQLLAAINAELVGVVAPMAAAGGLYPLQDQQGKQVDPGYKVVTDSSVNTISTMQNNEVHATVGLRISPTGSWVYITITKAAFTSGF